jgi:tRNA nucleotidyltransferase (CCA-adding enzyme)
MAKRAHVYPQVEPGAAGLINVAVATASPRASAGEALRLARRREAGVVQAGEHFVLREDLVHASLLGLEDVPARSLARPLPVVDAKASEVSVRRRLVAGARCVVVADQGVVSGAVTASRRASVTGPELGVRFERRLTPALSNVVVAARRTAAALGARVFLAGGVVRDLLRETAPGRDETGGANGDVDLVVEGDGLGFARALADALGSDGAASLVEHERFLTASMTVAGTGRIDVATARSERYERPGALPRVLPATIEQDLGRRDFSVNAMAVELDGGGFGLLDHFGGRTALARRRLSVLHTLSFVEDPTRMFRAARYGVRLGFALDAWTARVQALALQLAPYSALSGARLLTELELVVAEPKGGAALERLGRAGVLRLLDPRYRFARVTATRLGDLAPALDWVRAAGLPVSPVELALLTILADQPSDVAGAVLGRLGLSGEPRSRIERALVAPAPRTPADRPSARARRLRERSPLELAWLQMTGDDASRADVGWFVREARGTRPLLGGDDVVRLGVPRGPAVARALGALNDARLDGALKDREEEEAFVRDLVGRREEG